MSQEWNEVKDVRVRITHPMLVRRASSKETIFLTEGCLWIGDYWLRVTEPPVETLRREPKVRHGLETRSVRLTVGETQHLLTLLRDNEREGSYYGPREQHWKRSANITLKLEGIL